MEESSGNQTFAICLFSMSFSLGFFLVIEGERVLHVFAFFPLQQALSIMFSFFAFA